VRTDLFDFNLPEDRIALHPAEPRDSARLLVVEPQTGCLLDRSVGDLPDMLEPGDALVFNDTRVIPAALEGVRISDRGQANVDFNLIKRIDQARWRAFARPAKRLQEGDRVRFGHANTACLLGSLEATVAGKLDAGEVELLFDLSGPELDRAIEAVGDMPLPPYIALKRPPDESDKTSYQTIFAAKDGAIAAPTAGLHFTERLMEKIDARGISRHLVTLHVGAGTFLPVKAEDTSGHKMHSEWGEISAETAAAMNEVRARGKRVVAVGTTPLRTLESAAQDDGTLQAWSGETSIFITPGYRFKVIGALMTNFHLPRSTLFMLVSALSGLETMHAAYAHAIREKYRFYSYGDASLLFPSREAR
jgi:S-adenosylmethionine:tRNA ribosyltransferase-isomerase